MKVVLLSKTPSGISLAGAASRSCYSEKTASEIYEENEMAEHLKVINFCKKSGHHSILEHIVFSFSVEGVSRAMTHQLVRHRIASFSQQSQRYVKYSISNSNDDGCLNMEEFENYFVIPPEIRKDTNAVSVFVETCIDSLKAYEKLIESKIKKEDARFLLPNAMKTNIVVTMNVRELIHFFNLRTCRRAQWEIRDAATEMLLICKREEPELFKNVGPQCIMKGRCEEGKLSCGKPPVELKY